MKQVSDHHAVRAFFFRLVSVVDYVFPLMYLASFLKVSGF